MSFLSSIRNSSGPLDIDDFFSRMIDHYGLRHVVYHATNVNGLTADGQPYLKLTYDQDWIDRYFDQNYFAIDPVVEAGVANFVAFNWDTLDWDSCKRRKFRGDASEHKVGVTGLSVPIRGVAGEHAILSMTTDMTPDDWALFSTENMGDFQVIAHTLHQAILSNEGAPPAEPLRALGAREREVLQLYAHGLKTEAIGKRLQIGERTVRSYLESARNKLRASNTVNAVGRAIGRGIILPPM